MKNLILIIASMLFCISAQANSLNIEKKSTQIDLHELHELDNQLHQRENNLKDKFQLERSLMGEYDQLANTKEVHIPDSSSQLYKKELQAELNKSIKKNIEKDNLKSNPDVLAEYITPDNTTIDNSRVPSSINDEIASELGEL